MKKIPKLLLVLVLFIPIYLHAAMTIRGSYSNVVNYSRSYIYKYSSKDRYLLLGENIHGYNNGPTTSSDFSHGMGGFVSKEEFLLTVLDNNSYLTGGLDYWTQSGNGSERYVVSFDLITKSSSDNSGVRITEFVKPTTKVRGTGSQTNPWEFVENYSINIKTNMEGVSVTPSTGTYKRGETVDFVVKEKEGVMYTGVDNCGLVRAGSKISKYETPYKISPVYRDVTCTANFATRKIKVKYSCGTGSGSTEEQVIPYGSSYTLSNSGCTRTGYHQIGWITSTGYRFNYDASGKVSGAKWDLDEGEQGVENNTLNLTAIWEGNEYTITFYQGNGTSTAGATAIGSQTCVYGDSCTLKTYSSMGATLPLKTKESGEPCDYTWGFYGWANATDSLSRLRTDGVTFTYNTAVNSKLYVLEQRTLSFLGGVAPTSTYATQQQIWNPYSTASTQLTSITLPSVQNISGWSFVGFVPGLNNADPSKVLYNSSSPGTTVTPGVKTCKNIRSLYNRTVTYTFNGNNATGGSQGNLTATQYYNCGFHENNGTNVGANVSTPSITLPANNVFTRTGYTFSKWAAGSTGGTKYDAGVNYNGFAPGVSATNTTQTIYAIWSDTQKPTVTITAVDNDNNSTVLQAQATFNSDASGNTYAVNGGNWTNKGVKFNITLSDNEGVTSAQRRYNSSGLQDGASNINTYGNWEAVTLNSGGTGITNRNNITYEGSRKLQYEFSDAAGNKTSFTIVVKIDKTSPTCKLKINGSNVVFDTKSDNSKYVADSSISYGLSNSNSATYNSTSSLALGVKTYYGFVKDSAGNTGSCSLDVKNTTITQTTKKCNRSHNGYTKTTKKCNSSFNGYTKTSKTCNSSTSPYYSGLCNCVKKDGGSMQYSVTNTTYSSCSAYCISIRGYDAGSGRLAHPVTYSWGGTSTTYPQTCTANNISCGSSTVGKSNVTCTSRGYSYSWGGESSSTVSSCSSNNISCNSSHSGQTYVGCTDKGYSYSFGSSSSSTVTSCTENTFSCNSTNYNKTYTGCAYNCASGYTKHNNSYCYK